MQPALEQRLKKPSHAKPYCPNLPFCPRILIILNEYKAGIQKE